MIAALLYLAMREALSLADDAQSQTQADFALAGPSDTSTP